MDQIQININYIAVLVAAFVPMIFGGLWYSQVLFAKQFMALIGKSEEELKKNFNPARDYGLSFVGALIMSYVLSYFIHAMFATSMVAGMKVGFCVWLGFIVPTNVGSVIFEGRKSGLYILNMGYNLVCLLIMGTILSAWQ